MSFNTVGSIDVTITDAYISNPRWAEKPNEVNSKGIPVRVWGDLCLIVTDANGNNDIWRGEFSNRTGTGTRAHQEQTEITLEKLVSLGFNTPTFADFIAQCDENNGIPNLINLPCTVTTEERKYKGHDGQERSGIFIKYINARGAGAPQRISKAEFLARINGTAIPVANQGVPAPAYPAAPVMPTQAQPPQQTPGNVPPCPYN